MDRINLFLGSLIGREIGRMPRVDALKDLSVRIRPGEKVGVVGRNGAGKSTFLKAICGKVKLNSGSIHIDGRTHYLEPSNVTINAEMSLRENLVMNLELRGIPKREWEKCVASVEDFVDLGRYFDKPMKTLSLGMSARSVFAMVTELIDGDLIVVDEYLTAGDLYWQQRCARRFSDALSHRNNTLLLVSHSLDQVRLFCDRCLWIEGGRLLMDGPASDVINEYEAYLEKIRWRGDEDEKIDEPIESLFLDEDLKWEDETVPVKRFPGLGSLKIVWVKVNDKFARRHVIESLDSISIGLDKCADIQRPVRVIVTFWSVYGKRMAVLENNGFDLSAEGTESYEVRFDLKGGFEIAGQYLLSISVYLLNERGSAAESGSNRLDMINKAIEINCKNSSSECVLIDEQRWAVA